MARKFDEIISDIYQNKNTIKVILEWPIIFIADTFRIITSASFKLKNNNLAVVIFAYIMNSNPRSGILIILRNANSHQNLL